MELNPLNKKTKLDNSYDLNKMDLENDDYAIFNYSKSSTNDT